jgi:hypothetical protein
MSPMVINIGGPAERNSSWYDGGVRRDIVNGPATHPIYEGPYNLMNPFNSAFIRMVSSPMSMSEICASLPDELACNLLRTSFSL